MTDKYSVTTLPGHGSKDGHRNVNEIRKIQGKSVDDLVEMLGQSVF